MLHVKWMRFQQSAAASEQNVYQAPSPTEAAVSRSLFLPLASIFISSWLGAIYLELAYLLPGGRLATLKSAATRMAVKVSMQQDDSGSSSSSACPSKPESQPKSCRLTDGDSMSTVHTHAAPRLSRCQRNLAQPLISPLHPNHLPPCRATQGLSNKRPLGKL